MTLESGSLAAWTSTWLAGRIAFDDVIHAMSAPRVLVGAGVGPASVPVAAIARPISLGEALIEWRQSGAPVTFVLPVPGDVRGLPGPAEFRTAALDAGQAVLGGGLGLVPRLQVFGPSSAAPALSWWAFEIEHAPTDPIFVRDAQFELTEAVRESAAPLAEIGSFGWSDEVRDKLALARRAGERLDLPPGFPSEAVALLAQAERLGAVLDIALGGVAVDRLGTLARDSTLRELGTAVRRARIAGYNAAA